ncbi:hypothetical protein BCR34DRAFT_1954 [Clohesyomyces aquaticus]|uniref:Uncharacterized protein n=1 Tax=Clohesyomyces aquaticus TaxID=1231657 RepID=A0A1Y2ABS8_9PLEO|nr:hypothetical protein BCR34DRAFT_1954 [Clohesyomyces aquaticus]
MHVRPPAISPKDAGLKAKQAEFQVSDMPDVSRDPPQLARHSLNLVRVHCAVCSVQCALCVIGWRLASLLAFVCLARFPFLCFFCEQGSVSRAVQPRARCGGTVYSALSQDKVFFCVAGEETGCGGTDSGRWCWFVVRWEASGQGRSVERRSGVDGWIESMNGQRDGKRDRSSDERQAYGSGVGMWDWGLDCGLH